MTLEERAEEYLLNNFDPTEETTENDVMQAYIAGFKASEKEHKDDVDMLTVAYLQGADRGKQIATKWHDLRKNPNDLPKDCKNVLINALDYGINACYVAHRLNGKWWSNCKSETFIRVIAWQPLPPIPTEG